MTCQGFLLLALTTLPVYESSSKGNSKAKQNSVTQEPFLFCCSDPIKSSFTMKHMLTIQAVKHH